MATRNAIPLEKITLNGVTRPTRGSSVKVWDVADRLMIRSAPDAPERAKVLAECEKKGIATSTASNQYQKWRQHHGFGPKAPAKPKARKSPARKATRR